MIYKLPPLADPFLRALADKISEDLYRSTGLDQLLSDQMAHGASFVKSTPHGAERIDPNTVWRNV